MRCPKCRAENAGGALYCKMRGASMGGCEGRGAPGLRLRRLWRPSRLPGAVFAAADADSAATFSYPLAEGAADFARYQRQLADKAEQVKTAREAAALAAADFEMYRRRRRNCVIAGAVLVLLLALSFPSWIESYGANTGMTLCTLWRSTSLCSRWAPRTPSSFRSASRPSRTSLRTAAFSSSRAGCFLC